MSLTLLPGFSRLPRSLDENPRREQVLHLLGANTRLLWPGSRISVALVGITPCLGEALKSVCHAKQLVRGLELAEQRLAREQQGLTIAEKKTGLQRGERVSRLLLLADDGAERFYRNVEGLLRRHAPRVMAVMLRSDSATLGDLVFGSGSLARLLLIEHKDAVTHVLLSMAQE
ncbi:MAG TPA: hypothetical protein ENN05_06295 [Deltaproteobacteria bacterium]|nr:hypothetical protein [Deltaproteobacteria bacterium]